MVCTLAFDFRDRYGKALYFPKVLLFECSDINGIKIIPLENLIKSFFINTLLYFKTFLIYYLNLFLIYF